MGGVKDIFCRDVRGILPNGNKFAEEFEGVRCSLWFFIVYNIVITVRSLIHMVAPDSGLVSIAGVDDKVEGWGNINHFGGQWGLE